jgi:hypothetical protein
LPWIAIGAIGIFVVLAVWQALTPGSVFSLLSVWQIGRFGRLFPFFGVVLLVIIPALLIFLVFRFLHRREERSMGEVDGAIVRTERLLRLLSIAAGVLVAAVIGVLLSLLALPSDIGTPVRVDAATTDTPANGLTTLVGPLLRDRAIRYEKSIAGVTRIYQLVPVAPAQSGGALRYFVELPDTAPTNAATHLGVLVRDGLPLSARYAFEGAGYRLAEPAAMLSPDTASLRWARYALAAQLLVAAAVLLLAATLQWLVVRRIRRAMLSLP